MGKIVAYQHKGKLLPNQLLLMYRQRSGLTQNQLAAYLDLKSDRMIQKWESGYTLPTAARLQRLLKLYLQLGVFISGQECEEARKLWLTVKDMFDQNTATYETYPIFDEEWFSHLDTNFPIANIRPEPTSINTKLPVRAAPTTLPVTPNHLIGRVDEVRTVKALLAGAKQSAGSIRLLTLTGAGGTGKTRLAIQAAEELRVEFEQIWFVPLTSVQQPELIVLTIAKTLGLNEQPDLDTLQLLQNFLKARRALLVLDNFEHLLVTSPLVSQLLQNCPNIVILVTSRAALRIKGEQELAVSPLKLPPKFSPKAKQIFKAMALDGQYPAITLFVERARAVKPSFELEESNFEAVVEICQRLDGLPLALELAAAWISLLSPQNLLARLLDEEAHLRLKMLNTGRADLPERQKTIWASIHWSYGLLSEPAQILLRRLAIFNGEWELSTAEDICAGNGLEQGDILELLYQLVTHSLIVVEDRSTFGAAEDEPRYHLLETIRQYGWEQLQSTGELATMQDRLAMYYLKLVEEAEPNLVNGKEFHWRKRLISDIGNIRAALSWCLDASNSNEQAVVALRITTALRWIWFRLSFVEGRRWLELALEKLPEELKVTPNEWHAKGLVRAAHFAMYLKDYQQALQWSTEGLRISRSLNLNYGLVDSLRYLSQLANMAGQVERSQELAEEALVIAQKSDDIQCLAQAYAEVGRISYWRGNYTQSFFHFEEAIRVKREIGDTIFIAMLQSELCRYTVDQKDYSRTRELFMQSWPVFYETGDLWGLVRLIESGLLRLAVAEENFELVAFLYGMKEAMYENIGRPNSKDDNKIEQMIKTRLGEEIFANFREQGHQTTLAELMGIWGTGKLQLKMLGVEWISRSSTDIYKKD